VAAFDDTATSRSVAVLSAGSTSNVPRTMFIAQVKPNVPASTGRSSTVADPFAGSEALTPKSGKTTREVHSPDSRRVNTNRTGTP
jgi:hypothetical protein